jgi:hypothetical protein
MLTNDQVQQVSLVLSLGGWNEVMKPALIQRRDLAMGALVLSRSERQAKLKGTDFDTDDDVLRAMVKDCTWMTTVWDTELMVARHNQQRDELDAAMSSPANP